MGWDSEKYLRFKNERTQPSIDLANRLTSEAPQKIIDIGCGPGNSTAVLKSRYPSAHIIGADNSENMLASAREKHPDIEFILCDASSGLGKLDGGFDIVFSNACIQWIPEHRKLLPEMMRLLKTGGELAVQIPINSDEPVHRILGELSASEKWRNKFSETKPFHALSAEEYYDILSEISSDFEIWQITYFHRMQSHSDIIEWYRGTRLRPYLEALSENDAAEFEKEVFEGVVKAYPKQANGEIIFRFPRLFFRAVK